MNSRLLATVKTNDGAIKLSAYTGVKDNIKINGADKDTL